LGTLVDIGCSLLGGLGGIFFSTRWSSGSRQQFRYLLALAAILIGMKMTWDHCSGGFLHIVWQYGLGMMLLIGGNALGLLLRLQRWGDRLDAFVQKRASPTDITAAATGSAIALTLTPLLWVGTLAETQFADIRPILLKSAFDGLLVFNLTEKLRWPAFGGILALALFQFGIAFGLVRWNLESLVHQNGLHALGFTTGLLLLSYAVVIADFGRVNALNYLPALVLAPWVGRWW
jgi:uncharacterized membrane protein YqgA involved in biofilm formation